MEIILNVRSKIKGLMYCVVLSAAMMANTVQAAYVDFVGQSQAANLTAIPFVFGSTMWGSVEIVSGNGTEISGFNSLIGADPSKFTFTFGDLELTSFLSPGPATAGYEIYSESDASPQPIRLFYDSNEWAVGTLNYFRVDVENSSDVTAVGFATANLTAAGAADDAFFNEVMSLTGGTGLLNIQVDSFFPVDASGGFNSSGTISVSAVPLPPAMWLFGSACFGLLGFFKRRRA